MKKIIQLNVAFFVASLALWAYFLFTFSQMKAQIQLMQIQHESMMIRFKQLSAEMLRGGKRDVDQAEDIVEHEKHSRPS